MVPCDTQGEIDYFWERLSADPKAALFGLWIGGKPFPKIIDFSLRIAGNHERYRLVESEFVLPRRVHGAKLLAEKRERSVSYGPFSVRFVARSVTRKYIHVGASFGTGR